MMISTRSTQTFALAALLVSSVPAALEAQPTPCAAPAAPARDWVRLCASGNGIARLQRVVEMPRGTTTVGDAIREIARRAGVDVTLDASLPAVGDRITLAGGKRMVAEALLLVVDGRGIEIDVGADGGLIVVAAPALDPRAGSARVAIQDSVLRAVRLARVVVSATPNREGLFGTPPLVGMQTIGARELRLAPGFFGTDVLRNARLLPGLSARNDYSTALNVRGGESDQSIVTLDGIPLYHTFHLGGLLSSFIEPAVSGIDTYTGVLPARYGGHLSGVLDVRSAEEPRSGVHGSADLNLLASTAALGGTTRAGSTSWLVAGRRTYADAVATLVGQSLPYHFEDANLHLSHRFDGGSHVALTAYAGQDVIDYRGVSDTVLMSAGNRAAGVSWSSAVHHAPAALGHFGGSAAVEQRASLTAYHASAAADDGLTISSGVRDARVAGALSVFDSTTRHTLGYELARQTLDRSATLARSIPEARNFFPEGRSAGEVRSAALWYEVRRQVTSALSVEGGARGDLVAGIDGALLSPRMSARLAVDPSTAVTVAVGRHAQWMHSMLREEIPVRLLDFWIASDSALPPSRAWVYTLGLERRLDASRDLRVELFHKQLSGLVAPDALQDTLNSGEAIGIERGRSSGAEILLRQAEHNGFAGWLAYSFSVSRRTDAKGFSYAPAQDRRHELNLVGSWRTSRYLFGARFGLSTGTPYTKVDGVYQRERYDPVSDDWSVDSHGATRQYLLGPRNGERFPLAHRLDLSLTRIGRDGSARTTPYLSIANVYGAFNPAIYTFDYTGTPRERIGASNFRFLPTFGIRHVF